MTTGIDKKYTIMSIHERCRNWHLETGFDRIECLCFDLTLSISAYISWNSSSS